MSFWTKALSALKIRREEMRWPGQSLVMFDLGTTVTDLQIESWVGDGTESDIVMTPIRWLQRALPEAPLTATVNAKPAPLQKLLDRPNGFYSLEALLAATVYSLTIDGNAYWIVLRNASGNPVELWWVPHTMMEPKWPDAGTEYITHYTYTPSGESKRIEAEDVLHFRDGIDPRNIRKGLSPLRALLREVWSDREAAKFTGALLRNGGVPGIVISPKLGVELSVETAEAIKARIDSGFTGEQRGRTLALTGPVDLNTFGFSPKDLDLSPLRDISEERVSAAIGVPSAVVGWGAGLQQTKVGATMRELRQLAWWQAVIPMQRNIASEIERVLAKKGELIEFDITAVESLQESEDAKTARLERQVKAGLITRAEARKDLGREVYPTDHVYLLSVATVEAPAKGRRPEPPPPPLSPKTKEAHTLTEERIANEAPRRDAPAQLRAFASELDRLRTQAASLFQQPLVDLFESIGKRVEQAALDLLGGKALTAEDESLIEKILELLGLVGGELEEIYSAAYLTSARNVLRAMGSAYGIEIALSDPRQVEILRIGGTRAGLLDLDGQTREALFEALSEGREQGLASDNLARFIRDRVEAGPWRDAATRARVIARTEGAYAANTASIQGAREIPGVELMMIHDNRSGFDDDICSALDGRVVSIAEAEELVGSEHPNGTRSATPIPPLLAEEMGL